MSFIEIHDLCAPYQNMLGLLANMACIAKSDYHTFFKNLKLLEFEMQKVRALVHNSAKTWTHRIPAELFLCCCNFLSLKERSIASVTAKVWHRILLSPLGKKWFALPAPPKLYRDYFPFYLPFALKGHSLAQARIAECYQNGYGVKTNPEHAYLWSQKAADQGEPDGIALLGRCYHEGFGVAVDLSLALQLYRCAVKRKSAIGHNQLGFCHSKGDGVGKSESLAFRYYQTASDQGYTVAHFNLALFYSRGRGVPKDSETAFRLFLQAAQQGYPPSQLAVGLHFGQGIGRRVRKKKAFSWYLKAAEQGEPGGQYCLAECYRAGSGVDVDNNLARKWFVESAAQGYSLSLEALLSLIS